MSKRTLTVLFSLALFVSVNGFAGEVTQAPRLGQVVVPGVAGIVQVIEQMQKQVFTETQEFPTGFGRIGKSFRNVKSTATIDRAPAITTPASKSRRNRGPVSNHLEKPF